MHCRAGFRRTVRFDAPGTDISDTLHILYRGQHYDNLLPELAQLQEAADVRQDGTRKSSRKVPRKF